MSMVEFFCKDVPLETFDWSSKYISWQYFQKIYLKDFLFLNSYHVHFMLWIKSKKKLVTERNKRFNLWSLRPLFLLFKKFFHVRDQTFMMSTRRGDEMVLKFVTYLQILLFLSSRSGWGLFCWCHNCMIPNIETYFD